ncbi:hypothetical protein AAMO2058_001527300 [Amorphochlora amoebiformis]
MTSRNGVRKFRRVLAMGLPQVHPGKIRRGLLGGKACGSSLGFDFRPFVTISSPGGVAELMSKPLVTHNLLQDTKNKHESILSTIGRTPVVKLARIAPEGVNVYVKIEAFNPMGSVKDRLALGCIEWAEREGELKPGQTVIEATSGNTGIGLAMVCAAKGYPFVCTMAETFSVERRKLMRFLGAKVILTKAEYKGSGMVIKAQELAEKHGWFRPCQFENEANAWIHAKTTGPEILDHFKDEPLDHIFMAYGTGGTIKGVGTVLRKEMPKTKIVACEPKAAPMMYSEVPMQYHEDGSFVQTHPVWKPHPLQGWAPDFIPKLGSDAIASGLIDDIVHVTGPQAMETSIQLAQKEGIFTGTSGGGSLYCAIEFAKTAPKGSNILAVLADTGERYLSTPLFAGVPAEMTPEELAISDSTPGARPNFPGLPPVTEEASQLVAKLNKENSVMIWAIEGCPFCKAVCDLFDAAGVTYKRVDVDSFQLAKHNQGNQIRAALAHETKVTTFPKVFIKSKFEGGGSDTVASWKSGDLQKTLESAGVEITKHYQGNPEEFLP